METHVDTTINNDLVATLGTEQVFSGVIWVALDLSDLAVLNDQSLYNLTGMLDSVCTAIIENL